MMKSFMSIAAAVICFGSVVHAVPVQVKFTGYVEDNYLTPAGSEYFGVLPGDEFICILTYDPQTITNRPTVNTNPLDDHFIHLTPMGEVGISLAVDSPSQYLVETDPVNGAYYMHVIDSASSSQPGRVNVLASGLSPGYTSISMGLYEQDYQVALNGSTFPEINLERLLRGRFAVRSQGFRFQCTITGSELVAGTPPVIEVDIDIRPDSDRNNINLRSNGVVAVVVYGAEDFDVTWIDSEGVMLFDSETEVEDGATPLRWVLGDADLDGYSDMLFHFATSDLRAYLDEYSVEACLVGLTVDEQLFIGTDTVNAFYKGNKILTSKNIRAGKKK